MNEAGKGWRALCQRAAKILSLGGLSITGRLALAFVAVAGIAVTAPLLVDRAATIILQRDVALPGTPPAAEPASVPSPQVHSPVVATPALPIATLRTVLRQHDDAVRRHAETESELTGTRHAEADAELLRALDSLAALETDDARKLAQTIEAHRVTAKAFVSAAHERQRFAARHSIVFTRMYARLQESIDGAWKIMGRVVARQSILRLSAELDAIQQAFADRNSVSAAGNSAKRIAQAEQAFAATLQENEKGLRRSQGAEWFDAMRTDLAQLTSAGRLLLDAEARELSAARSFGREGIELGRQLAALAAARTVPSQVVPATPPAATPATLDSTLVTQTTSSLIPAGTPHRRLVAWLALAVLAVVAYLAITTIISIVRPVRRLLAATDRLARGDKFEPVATGGIRELDRLAHSFNDMATQVIAAQSRLETRVAERTKQLRHLAERDPLTGLVNRRQLFVALDDALMRAQAQGQHVGVFFLDLDNFKTLNDSLGHAYGDQVLRAIAARLDDTARLLGFAARLGGDEFMVVHEGAATYDIAVSTGNRLIEAFQAPLAVDGRELIVSVSLGAAVYPDHERDAEALLRAADTALFQAKALGRSQLVLFTPELHAAANAKFAIEQPLRRAIQKGEFELFYQPEISVQNLEVNVVEALLRWRTPEGDYRAPGEFLAVAEESGLISEISDWVLRTAIAAAARWHRGGWPNARVAINMSPRQFLAAGFVEQLQATLEDFGLPARCVELELTESMLQTGPATVTTLRRLRDMGVAIALDDFGVGFSSMASLEQLPLSRVKLDRSLIARMDSSARSASIARATIGLCSDLGLEVTAEGVERLEQFAMLLNYPAMSLQGFLICGPVHEDELLGALRALSGRCQELVLWSREVAQGGEREVMSEDWVEAGQARLN